MSGKRYTGANRCRIFGGLWVPKDVSAAGAMIGIRIMAVHLLPGKVWGECLGCHVELLNRGNGKSVRDMYELSYSKVDAAFHFPATLNQANVWNLAESLGVDLARDLNQAKSFMLKIQRSCERALFFFHDRWAESWLVKEKILPAGILNGVPGVVTSESRINTDAEGNIVSTEIMWPELSTEAHATVSIRRTHKRSIFMEKDNILIRVPFEERAKAKELGLKWSGRQQSWIIPGDMPLEGVKEVLTHFSSQTPEEAKVFAKEQRESQAFKEMKHSRKQTSEQQEPIAEMEEVVDKAQAQRDRNYLQKTIYPYARLYLRPKNYTADEREALKAGKAVYDPDNKRWCVDRRLPVSAFAQDIPEYIVVPLEEKDHVKELGAKWDHVQRSWYIPKGVEQPELNVYTRLKDAPVRNYIAVPPEDEKTVRDLGALYDQIAKCFFIPREENPEKFERWKLANLSPAVISRPKLSETDRERMNEYRERRTQEQSQSQSHGRRLSRHR